MGFDEKPWEIPCNQKERMYSSLEASAKNRQRQPR
jgi:hypothetical protein